ncbi:FAD/NAD(P)-binding domain-containing protein [Exidia glandulosa HHB12029]|uniref:FAD/NAD(P)-binding domain-containing protein n=1 Tax=Exidia glandulosa HHB12029 TaxID=1314781 RepID=A0A165D2V6_EXIGL|nr:FAD/NAD(P)-binding domain-containing protein [Exidia glandulosa HHB12029]
MSLPAWADIVIVGAGPAGLACALFLAAHKVPFLLLDALPEGQNQSRASVVHAYALEQLEALGCVEELVAQGIKMSELVSLDTDEQPITRVALTSALAKYTRYPFGLLIAQCDVEAILIKRLRELGGVIHRERRVARVEDSPDGLIVILEDGASVRAQYVVAADGSKLQVRASANIPFLNPSTGKPATEASPTDVQFVLADIFLREPLPRTLPTTRIWARFDHHGITLLIPIVSSIIKGPAQGHLYRFAGSLPPGTPVPHAPDAAYLQAMLNERGPAEHAKLLHVASGSRYRVRSGLAAQFAKHMPQSGGWVLLCGDAAHIHSPAGGQGMNLGLCDGVLLGRALLAEREDQTAAFERYNKTRRVAATGVITMAGRMTSLYVGWFWRTRIARTVFNFFMRIFMAIPGIRGAVAWRISGLVYRDSV